MERIEIGGAIKQTMILAARMTVGVPAAWLYNSSIS